MLRLFVSNNDHLEIAACDLASVPAKPAGAAWYDLFNPTPEEDRFVEASLGIDIPTREEMKDIEPSARLYKEAGAEFMTMTAMTNLDTDQPVKSPVTFVLRENILVTVRYSDPKPFKLFPVRAAKPGGVLAAAAARPSCLGLIEAFIDRLAQVLENASDEIDQISHEVFRSRSRSDKREPPGPAVGDRADRPQGRTPDDGPRKPAEHPAADQLPPGRRRGQEGDGRNAAGGQDLAARRHRACRPRRLSVEQDQLPARRDARPDQSRAEPDHQDLHGGRRSPSCRRRWSPRSTA